MFKALDVRDNSEIIILDPLWKDATDELRELGHQDILVCQGCRQPVRVRSGPIYRTHFAHKHKENCEFVDESPELREARAVLYEWLVSKFKKDNVTIEKKIDGLDLYRPVDCWVEKDQKRFAYWIFESTHRPAKRDRVKGLLLLPDVQVNWVFVSKILRRDEELPESAIILSTTEREFLKPSKYDAIGSRGYLTDGTLHYLDAKKRELITFRSLSIYHSPQVYKGHNLVSDLAKILISGQTGEFVHAGEHEHLLNLEHQPRQEVYSYRRIIPTRKENQLREHLARSEYSTFSQEGESVESPDESENNFQPDNNQSPQEIPTSPPPVGKTRWEQYSYQKYPHLVPRQPAIENPKSDSDEEAR